MSIKFNPKDLVPASPQVDAMKILQRADVVWSRIKLEPGEYLLVKIGKHMGSQANEIQKMIDSVFKRESDRVLIYTEGDLEISKVVYE